MNTTILTKKAKNEINILRKAIKSAKRTLLEFEIAQSEWDLKKGRYKIFDSASSLIRYINQK